MLQTHHGEVQAPGGVREYEIIDIRYV